jgi:hypothetical protein
MTTRKFHWVGKEPQNEDVPAEVANAPTYTEAYLAVLDEQAADFADDIDDEDA